MGKETKTVTTYICDMCGHETNDANDTRDHTSGSANIKYSARIGGASYNGDWGGSSFDGNLWLCQECTNDFLKFINSKSKSIKG